MSVVAARRMSPAVEPETCGGLGTEPYVELGDQELLLDLQAGDTFDRLHHVGDFLRLGAKDVHVGAEDSHHDRGAGAGQHLFDALFQIGQDVLV